MQIYKLWAQQRIARLLLVPARHPFGQEARGSSGGLVTEHFELGVLGDPVECGSKVIRPCLHMFTVGRWNIDLMSPKYRVRGLC